VFALRETQSPYAVDDEVRVRYGAIGTNVIADPSSQPR
jgi:hypothetical protein